MCHPSAKSAIEWKNCPAVISATIMVNVNPVTM